MKRKNSIIYWIYILPAFILYTIALLAPILLGTIPFSFLNWNLMSGKKIYIGLLNFKNLFVDHDFFRVLLFTLKIGIIGVIGSNIFAFILAYYLSNRYCFAKNISRSLFFIPNIISAVLVAFVWMFIFTWVMPSLGSALHLEWLQNLSWFGSPSTATFTIIVVTIWQGIGFALLIYIAGFQTVPKELIEAGEIDGCTGWQNVLKIQLPMIMPTVTINLFVSIAASFKAFDVPFALTDGGPYGTTQTVALNIYREAFIKYSLGMGSAKALVLFLLVVIITLLQLKITRSMEVDS